MVNATEIHDLIAHIAWDEDLWEEEFTVAECHASFTIESMQSVRAKADRWLKERNLITRGQVADAYSYPEWEKYKPELRKQMVKDIRKNRKNAPAEDAFHPEEASSRRKLLTRLKKLVELDLLKGEKRGDGNGTWYFWLPLDFETLVKVAIVDEGFSQAAELIRESYWFRETLKTVAAEEGMTPKELENGPLASAVSDYRLAFNDWIASKGLRNQFYLEYLKLRAGKNHNKSLTKYFAGDRPREYLG